MSHSHDHNHDHHSANDPHDHSSDIQPALQTLLWQQIEFEKILTLNERPRDAGARIVEKTWPQRLDPSPMLSSDADEQLLMTVPFAGSVKLHSLLVRSSDSGAAPKTLKLFANRDGLDFDAAGALAPTQVLTLARTGDVQEVPVKRALFGGVYSLTLFFEDNYGEEVTGIYYLGFKGDFTRLSREPVEVLYEKAANPRDHAPIVGIGDMAASGARRGM
ncbi:hypothetical protein MMC13_004008 [Lambiella insularis]|nr:hypothetical protein [Lambiella insularis]